jgi:hypothetical protein
LTWATLAVLAALAGAIWIGRRWERVTTRAETERQRRGIQKLVNKVRKDVAEYNDTELDDGLRDPARTRAGRG